MNNCRFEGFYLIGYNISRWLNILAKGVIKKMKKILFTTNPKIKYVEMEKTDPTFYAEIGRGIVLWEAKDES